MKYHRMNVWVHLYSDPAPSYACLPSHSSLSRADSMWMRTALRWWYRFSVSRALVGGHSINAIKLPGMVLGVYCVLVFYVYMSMFGFVVDQLESVQKSKTQWIHAYNIYYRVITSRFCLASVAQSKAHFILPFLGCIRSWTGSWCLVANHHLYLCYERDGYL